MADDAQRRERKVVSVLFCDLVGFTQQAEALDPEDVEAILRPYHARVRAELERHGGTVEKFIGDAVMALFGAPTAHEDDPERAVRAALAICDFALEEGLELRIGITTGEALVALDADPASGQGMASGDVVNTAARLQGAAPVNEILADETTYRATRTTITYERSDPVEAKGKSRPIDVWRALEARSRFGVDVAHEARAELVGRDRELSALRDAFERAREDRTSQLVTLVGVPGIGKSRLVYELRQIADADPDIITWRQGRCLAYGEGVTLWALGEIVKAQAGIVEQDDAEEVTSKIQRALAEALPENEAAWVEAHLLALVGLAEEAEVGGDRRNEAFSAWRRFLEGLAEGRTLVLVFEDLHWADEALLDFVDQLVDWVGDVPLLVLATARPELLERRPAWGGGKLNATTLALSPLSEEDTSLLLGRLLGRPLLAADAQRALLERAGGNPLYAEQFTDLYVERGSTDELPLPETLQGIIAARLDGLSALEKSLLQEASVMGKVFWASGLGPEADVAGALHGLERKGFVRRQRRSSLEGETEFAFAHALVRDVAYGQIARADRARKHRDAAEWIEGLGRPEDHAELVAHHWRSALELARAAGSADEELVTKARLSLRDAGDRTAALYAHAVAAAQYEDALALWPDDDERPDLLFRRARALFYAYDEERREAALTEARDGFLAHGDALRAGEAEALLASVAWDRGHQAEARRRLDRARALVGDQESPETTRVLALAARMLCIAEETQAGLELAESALAMADRLGLDELRAHALTTVGMARNDLDEGSGTADMERARALARDIGSPLESPILNNLAVQATIEADIARSEALYAEAVALAERFGDRSQIRFLRGNLVWAAYMRGRWDEALAEADAFIAECEAGSPHTQEATVRMSRGMLLAARGDVARALDDLERAVELARGRDGAATVIATLSAHAAVLAELGRHDDARALVVEVVRLVREFGSHGALTRLAAIARELGVAEELLAALAVQPPIRARRWRETIELALRGEFAEAADRASAGGATTAEALLRHAAGASLLAQGRPDEGRAQIERALAFFTSVGATHTVARIEAVLGDAQSASA